MKKIPKQEYTTEFKEQANGYLKLTQNLKTGELGWSSDTGDDILSGDQGNDTLVGDMGSDMGSRLANNHIYDKLTPWQDL